MTPLRAPFPYFGGKRKVADVVWQRLGDVRSYVEPFFGSGAVLLARPDGDGARVETVNDIDGFIANFWRAVAADPEAVAHHADWPVNENDLHARHAWLVGQRDALTARLEGDPDYHDARIAGWWCWGACAWIGSGWCSGRDLAHFASGEPGPQTRPAMIGERLTWCNTRASGAVDVTGIDGGIVHFRTPAGERLTWGDSGTGLIGADGRLVAIVSELRHDGTNQRLGTTTGAGEAVQVP